MRDLKTCVRLFVFVWIGLFFVGCWEIQPSEESEQDPIENRALLTISDGMERAFEFVVKYDTISLYKTYGVCKISFYEENESLSTLTVHDNYRIIIEPIATKGELWDAQERKIEYGELATAFSEGNEIKND